MHSAGRLQLLKPPVLLSVRHDEGLFQGPVAHEPTAPVEVRLVRTLGHALLHGERLSVKLTVVNLDQSGCDRFGQQN